jgi:hypothetical protein
MYCNNMNWIEPISLHVVALPDVTACEATFLVIMCCVVTVAFIL